MYRVLPSSPQAQLAVASPVVDACPGACRRARRSCTPPGPVANRLPSLSTFMPSGRPLLAFLDPRRGVEEHAALAERAVGLHGERLPDRRLSGSDCATYSVFSSGEKAMPLGRVISLVSSVTLPSVAEAIDAAEIELLRRVVQFCSGRP